jgi:16S rRNA (cytosine967-C5)-methyltransferase
VRDQDFAGLNSPFHPGSGLLCDSMSDSATLNHAARILAAITPDTPADQALRRYLSDARRLGGREKRSISQAVFAYFRWLQWLEEAASAQKQVDQALALQAKFNADVRSVKAETLAARAVPAWSREELDFPADTLRQLQREPVLWLRARPGKAAELSKKLGRAEPPPSLAATLPALEPAASDPARKPIELDALRYNGSQDLFLTAEFHEGAFEIQDLASQVVGHACDPKAGETWWDACAGEGGKLLHLADLMQNKGLLWATDRSERRLHSLKRRAARAKIFNFRAAPWDGSARLPTKTKFDGILLDAPCSGLGTWQRNPHARWTASPNDVRELSAIQASLLQAVSGSLKPGGRLVYAVCTLTRAETTVVADAFTAAHPELEPISVLGRGPQLTLWPHEISANGMFIAAWRKR